MTREEAIKELQESHDMMRNYDIDENESRLMTALNMAIRALEQEQYYKELANSYEKTINKLTKAISEQEPKTDKALNLLAEWAVECGFGYDNIPEQYEKYKDNIADMGYAEGLEYIAKMESEE